MAEEHEIEGEIYDDSHIDIDAKIQTVLADHMKDFEGAVSAENLGPKFGVYGSFFPIDQLVFQPQISQKLPTATLISSHKHIRIRIKFRSSDNAAAALKSSDLHTASDKTHCPELTTSGNESPSHQLLLSLYKEIRFDVLHVGSRGFYRMGTSIDVKSHNGREVSVKKRKLREQDYLGNDLGESDANALDRELGKQKKSKVIHTEKKKSSRSKGEGKSRRRDRGIKDSAPIERTAGEQVRSKATVSSRMWHDAHTSLQEGHWIWEEHCLRIPNQIQCRKKSSFNYQNTNGFLPNAKNFSILFPPMHSDHFTTSRSCNLMQHSVL
ncbi:hypothetical protein RDI58_020382 [Solanum bulbocastanum]|uniref:Uncharacterized protein n=1 Tax=Solanum bulbocastanum TaxID=147425 RepID=A0AAN8TF36_SOLBU